MEEDWLAKRFGRGPPGAQRAASVERPKLPESAYRSGDSPRTAAWRAVMAQMTLGDHDKTSTS